MRIILIFLIILLTNSYAKDVKIEKKLTPCLYKRCKKRYSFEINLSKIEVNPKIEVIKLNSKNSNIKKSFKVEKSYLKEDIKFYFDIYLKSVLSQKGNDDFKSIAKLGLMYKLDLEKFSFFTDDRIAFSFENYQDRWYRGLYFDVNQLFLKTHNINYNILNFVIGRKKIKDYNSLFYNSSLDLIGFYNLNDLLLYRLYFGTRLSNLKLNDEYNLFDSDIKKIRFIVFNSSYQYSLNGFFSLIGVYEDSTHTNLIEKRKGKWVSLGVRDVLNVLIDDKLLYYANLSFLSEEISNSKGNSVFVGFLYSPKRWNNKSIGISFAYASKDYFQPYISNNKSDFLSKNLSFKYFGEFLDPMLSNLDIFSLYFKGEGIDYIYMLAYHKYLKVDREKDVYLSRYVNNTSNSLNIGDEIDLFYKYFNAVSSLEFGLGYFVGGDAKTNKKDGLSVKVNYRYYW